MIYFGENFTFSSLGQFFNISPRIGRSNESIFLSTLQKRMKQV